MAPPAEGPALLKTCDNENTNKYVMEKSLHWQGEGLMIYSFFCT